MKNGYKNPKPTTDLIDSLPKVQYGTVDVECTANTISSQTVNFPEAFSSTPSVVCVANTGSPGTLVTEVGVNSVGKAGFTCNVYRTAAATQTVRWIAVGI